ncbi:hypothetical protein CCACVL1_16257 [Corchorus capsularis]|uniref:Uncharacterized protein n=1 Tax=Corchorus capsularis TaxID=210143 RepID=A0A1R3HY51_COCAP|nr:hypothetical protein CCACVL1_28967 [Corchorus capsularis]OMO75265.1 hypothetical protein CCACVL1_16257 [Corchorus capsularis]
MTRRWPPRGDRREQPKGGCREKKKKSI